MQRLLGNHWSKGASIATGAGALGACFLLGYAAAATPDENAPGRNLAYSGTLTADGAPLSGAHDLEFKFKKNGTEVCSSGTVAVNASVTGQFYTLVPIASCPATLFDGQEVSVDLVVDSTLVLQNQPISAAPHAKFAEQVGVPDCPLGYTRSAVTEYVVCVRGKDEIVRVGNGQSAFWMDRYEASVWSSPAGAEPGFGPDTYPIPRNAQVGADVAAFAASVPDVPPGTVVSWFQASFFCRQAGKRLPTGDEWLAAARATPDSNACNRSTAQVRVTGASTGCVSFWGAHDMVGNLGEYTADWAASPNEGTDTGSGFPSLERNWPAEYGNDQLHNVRSGALVTSTSVDGWAEHAPAAVVRGGASVLGEGAGVFTYQLGASPTMTHWTVGFRCLTPR